MLDEKSLDEEDEQRLDDKDEKSLEDKDEKSLDDKDEKIGSVEDTTNWLEYQNYLHARDIHDVDDLEDDDDDNESITRQYNTSWLLLKNYIYNSESGTCCDRNTKQWIMLGVYYILYSTFIISLYLGFLYGSFYLIKYINPDYPIIDKGNMMAKASPGIGFVPNMVLTKTPIIWYSNNPLEEQTEIDYVNTIDNFILKYKQANPANYINCDKQEKRNKLCFFNLKDLKECGIYNYHYTMNSLCFYLKLNKLPNWIPIYYYQENELSEEVSETMINGILEASRKNMIYLECLGLNLWDNQHLGNLTYYPQQGIKGYYFPYKGEKDYLTPLVAVKLSNFTTGVVIHIKCTIYLKNIENRLNHIIIRIFIDNNPIKTNKTVEQ